MASVAFPTYKEVLQDFVTQAGFQLPPNPADPGFEEEVIDACMGQDLPTEKAIVLAKVGAATAKWFYPSHPRELQLEIAKFTAFATIVDDLGCLFPDALRTYRERLISGQPMDAKIMQALMVNSQYLSQTFFDTWDGDMIVKGVLEFFSANRAEIERSHQLKKMAASSSFTTYFRLKSGVTEPYAYFLFPVSERTNAGDFAHRSLVPDLMAFMNEVNDLMSFYKESMVGDERDNAIHMHACATGEGLTQALLDYRASCLELIRRLRATAAELGPDVQRKVDEFLNGYMAFHLMVPRYRLSELSLSYANPVSASKKRVETKGAFALYSLAYAGF
uniref:Terpenoid synthase n=1 Tax=Mycena chlorophos TaxID=658473 RepID=A0ABQ0KUW9_MYCCL|nr:predicted protein [Mycena chlorophos]